MKQDCKTFVFKCETKDGKLKYVTVQGRSITESIREVKSRSDGFISVETVS